MVRQGQNSVFTETPAGLVARRPDNTEITLRGLMPSDADQHVAHLKRLNPEDRHLRFQTAMSDEGIARYSDHFNWDQTLAFGVFADDTLRGIGELFPEPNGVEAEVSVSVEREFQQMGIGRLLVVALIIAAKRVGIRKIKMYYMVENDAMRSLAEALGGRSYLQDGMSVAEIAVPALDERLHVPTREYAKVS